MLEKLEVRKTPKSEENSVFEKPEVAESPGEKTPSRKTWCWRNSKLGINETQGRRNLRLQNLQLRKLQVGLGKILLLIIITIEKFTNVI